MFEDIKGKIVIVTGGTKGIGKGCSMVFTRSGAVVVAGARNEKDGKALQDEMNKSASRFVFRRCDVSEPEQVKELIDFTVERFGRLDCLINNAGYFPRQRYIDDVDVAEFRDILDTNLVSMFCGCKYALPHLRKTKGSIINMGSITGLSGQEGSVSYTASKGGISAMTKTLAVDEARNGVRVNCVLPGNIKTESYEVTMSRAVNREAYAKKVDSLQWMGRCGTVEEVGEACLFLASGAASFITGIELMVTGGVEIGQGYFSYKIGADQL